MPIASKHINTIIGVDIHLVNLPTALNVPMPHPFIGVVFDPIDYLPVLGTQVHVNGQKRANAGTTATLGTGKHIPLGVGFAPSSMPVIAHEGLSFFGSQTVRADGSYFSTAGQNIMTCSCVGIPLGSPERYLPTSVAIHMPIGGNPVNIGGPVVPDVQGVAMRLAMGAGLKFLIKKAPKTFKRVQKKWLNKKPKPDKPFKVKPKKVLYRDKEGFKAAIERGETEVYYLGKHKDIEPRPTGVQSHHGVVSVWMSQNYKDYKMSKAPTVYMLNDPKHNATRKAFSEWRLEKIEEKGGCKLDYTKISKKEVIELSERQFDGAKVPNFVRNEYYKLWEQHLKTLTLR